MFGILLEKCTLDETSQLLRFFLDSNGVKQGGSLSPMLFNVHMDKISIKLNQSGIGGGIVGHLIIYSYYCYVEIENCL